MKQYIIIVMICLFTQVISQEAVFGENIDNISATKAKEIAISILGNQINYQLNDKSLMTNKVVKSENIITNYQKEFVLDKSLWSVTFINISFDKNKNSLFNLSIYVDANTGALVGGHTNSSIENSKINDLREVSTEFFPFQEDFGKISNNAPKINLSEALTNCPFFSITKEFSFVNLNYSSNFQEEVDAWIIYLEGIPPLTTMDLHDSLYQKISNYRYVVSAIDGSVISSGQYCKQ